jgi:hypothetical protein
MLDSSTNKREPPRYNWNIVENGVKHHKPNQTKPDMLDSVTVCRFRTINNKLPIETGKWQIIDRGQRICNLCNKLQIGDEYHYFFNCIFLRHKHKEFIKAFFH